MRIVRTSLRVRRDVDHLPVSERIFFSPPIHVWYVSNRPLRRATSRHCWLFVFDNSVRQSRTRLVSSIRLVTPIHLLYSFHADVYLWSDGSGPVSSTLNLLDVDCNLQYLIEWYRWRWVEFHIDGAYLHPAVLESWTAYSIDEGMDDAYCSRHDQATTKKETVGATLGGTASPHTFSNFASIRCPSKRLSLSRVVDSLCKRVSMIEFVFHRCLPPGKNGIFLGDFHCCCYSSSVHRPPRHWISYYCCFHGLGEYTSVMSGDAWLCVCSPWMCSRTSAAPEKNARMTTEMFSTRSVDGELRNVWGTSGWFVSKRPESESSTMTLWWLECWIDSFRSNSRTSAKVQQRRRRRESLTESDADDEVSEGLDAMTASRKIFSPENSERKKQ